MTEIELLERVKFLLNPSLASAVTLLLKVNMGSENSVVVQSKPSVYSQLAPTETLFFRTKQTGKSHYVSFPSRYRADFEALGILTVASKSQPDFIRMDFDTFCCLIDTAYTVGALLNKVFSDLFNYEAFGCCSSYLECSNQRQCIHPDPAYATACQYRKHLEAGCIFYGENKNI